MKTSKEMQLKIIDKMRENVEGGKLFYRGLEYKNYSGDWVEEEGQVDLEDYEYRLKPETITINGVEIPKPLNESDIVGGHLYFCVNDDIFLYKSRSGTRVLERGIRFVYETKEEAIEASKALFGIKC